METVGLKRFAQGARSRLMGELGARLDQVLGAGSLARRGRPEVVAELERVMGREGRDRFLDRVAYLWFNRFCALRFMDVRGYNAVGVVSPGLGGSQPEILAEAKAGHFEADLPGDRVLELLGRNEDEGAYGLLVVGVCNRLSVMMPGLFERIDDYTELLLPGDLLSENGFLAGMRGAMTAEVCGDVEVIGWLYQFYIGERKDEVFARLKRNQKIEAVDIPAATQLFTPKWIVRYLVENSLGRLWMLNRPGSRLVERMEFYVGSLSPLPTSYLKISSPEEIKVCDPACGSGHILVYAFDLLYAIYEEEGYSPVEIPGLILEHNLFGVDVDARAVWLAQFALLMKGRERDRRFLGRGVLPQVCLLEGVVFEEGELGGYFDVVGRDLFSGRLLELLHQFKEGDNFGSLIRPVVVDCDLLNEQGVQENLFLHQTHEKVLKVLKFAEFLSCRYHVVVANPPYMGSKGMNNRLKVFLQDEYKDYKSDLFSACMVRFCELVKPGGFVGMMTPFNWMFLSSFEKLRSYLLDNYTLTNLVRPEFHAFFDSAYVTICAFTLFLQHEEDYKGAFIDLQEFYGADLQPVKALEAVKNPDCGWLYHAAAADFKKIPGGAIAYWVSEKLLDVFANSEQLGNIASPRQGLATADNDRFLRLWFEVNYENIGFGMQNRQQAKESEKKWFPYNKGGEFRKWYGNQEYLVNWHNDGYEVRKFGTENGGKQKSRPQNTTYYFQESVSWSKVTSGSFSLRFFPKGFIFADAGMSIFNEYIGILKTVLGVMNSPIMSSSIGAISPTLNFEVGQISNFPISENIKNVDQNKTKPIDELIDLSRQDWDSYETSWEFTTNPLIQLSQTETEKSPLPTSHSPLPTPHSPLPTPPHSPLPTLYTQLRQQWATTTQQMQQLEQQNNQIFIQAYGLQNELTPQIPLKEITLTCNPHYRYGIGECEVGSEQWEEMEKRLKTDTIQELISYAIGCIFGRYSLHQPGLILANQNQTLPNPEGEKFFAPTNHSPLPTSHSPLPTSQNIIPIIEGDWFPNDLNLQIRTFLRIALGTQHYQQNLTFIETALSKPLQKYLLKDLYNDHIKRYKKRPIYWLYSSPKNHFNALIYMHRYQPDTTNLVLDHLRQYQNKLTLHQTHLQNLLNTPNTPKPEQAKATRTLQTLKKILIDLNTYEREILYPLALQQVAIDLDDGVKTNYLKLGKALKPIPGLNS